MVRSESSERGKKSKKKVLKNRSRSRSTSSGRNRRSHCSRSKERKKYRSHSCDRSRSHSNSSERTRRSRRSQSKERKQYRSHSRDKRRSRSRDRRRSSSSSKERTYKRDKKNLDSSSRRYSSDDSSSIIKNRTSEISLKDRIKVLTDRNERKNEQIIPTFEQIMKIENESFVQETFSSTNSQIPQQMTKKKKKKKQKNQVPLVQNLEQPKLPTISHENAIFGSTIETMHVGRFNSRIIGDRKETLKNFESDDLIFGAMFCEKSEVRMKRWIEKLILLRKSLTEIETIS